MLLQKLLGRAADAATKCANIARKATLRIALGTDALKILQGQSTVAPRNNSEESERTGRLDSMSSMRVGRQKSAAFGNTWAFVGPIWPDSTNIPSQMRATCLRCLGPIPTSFLRATLVPPARLTQQAVVVLRLSWGNACLYACLLVGSGQAWDGQALRCLGCGVRCPSPPSGSGHRCLLDSAASLLVVWRSPISPLAAQPRWPFVQRPPRRLWVVRQRVWYHVRYISQIR